METDNPDLDNLYLKKLNGTLSPTEEIKLNEQLASNTQAQKELEEYRSLWESTATLSLKKGLTGNDRWNNLQEKLQRDSRPKSQLHYKLIFRCAAALVAVVMVLGAYFALNTKTPVTVRTAYGETKNISLPDQSTITLNAGTTVTYDLSSWDEERMIHIEGEAYFNVKKKGVPFVVTSNENWVTVLGTAFNVRSRDQTTTVTCLTGKVSFGRPSANLQPVILTKGTGATITGTTLSEIFEINADEAIHWMTGGLSFNNTPIKDVFAEFERHFNVSIIVKKDLRSLTFTGKFKNPTLKSAIETVCLSAGLAYSINKDSITIE